jgi:hypothetical protein
MGKKRLRNRTKQLQRKVASRYPFVKKLSGTQVNSSSAAKVGKRLKQLKTISRVEKKLRKAFIEAASTHPDLKPLQDKLKYLGLTLEEFLDLVDIKKLLNTKYKPKGTINEILILKDKAMVNILTERADGSFHTFDVLSGKELESAVGNVVKKAFDLAEFADLKTRLAINFKTLPDNKLYFDFSMVRFNPAKKKLFILIPGEIKEPKAAAELAKQFGRFVRRLALTDKIEFQLDKKPIEVNSKDVFFLKNNAAGIGRTLGGNYRTGKTISEKTPVMEIVHAKFKNTRPERNRQRDRQEFIRFLVKIDKGLNPEKIDKALRQVKKSVLQMSRP